MEVDGRDKGMEMEGREKVDRRWKMERNVDEVDRWRWVRRGRKEIQMG